MYSGSICYRSVLRVCEYQLFIPQHFHCQKRLWSLNLHNHRQASVESLFRLPTQPNAFGEIFGPSKKLGNIKQTSWFTFCRGSRLTTPADWDIGRQPIKITLCQNRPNSNDGIFDSVSISFLSHPSEERDPVYIDTTVANWDGRLWFGLQVRCWEFFRWPDIGKLQPTCNLNPGSKFWSI